MIFLSTPYDDDDRFFELARPSIFPEVFRHQFDEDHEVAFPQVFRVRDLVAPEMLAYDPLSPLDKWLREHPQAVADMSLNDGFHVKKRLQSFLAGKNDGCMSYPPEYLEASMGASMQRAQAASVVMKDSPVTDYCYFMAKTNLYLAHAQSSTREQRDFIAESLHYLQCMWAALVFQFVDEEDSDD